MTKSKSIMIIVGVVVVLLLIAAAAIKTGKVNISSVPTVGTVNGVGIPKKQYDTQYTGLIASLKAQGTNTDDPAKQAEIKKQVLDNLVDSELLLQGAKAAGITVTDADVETQFQAVVTQSGGAEGFKTALAKANLTEPELRTNIKNQLIIQKYLQANIKTDTITVSDAEIATFYADYSKTNGTSTPPLKTLSDQIKQQITLNKQQQLVLNFIDTLKAKAKIETTI